MDYLLSILAGALQGITEFLPISSSGHLILFHDILKFNLPDDLLFDVVLHWGTLVALLLFFYKEVWQLIKGFFSSLRHFNLANDPNQRLAWLIVLGTIPAAAMGYFWEDYFGQLRSVGVVAVMLIFVAILFLLAEKYSQKIRNLDQSNWIDAILIGVAQGIALIPGVSRSGITIITGLARNMKRETAAKFSFLLSMPIVFAAGAKEMFNIGSISETNVIILLLGFISSAVTGYFVIKFLLKFLNNHSLKIFAYYRLVIGFLLLAWIWLGRG